MSTQISNSSRAYPVRDAAVDGLLRGLAAGSAMLLYLILAALTLNESPLTLLGRFAGNEPTLPLVGFASHMGMSAVYGILFVLPWRLSGRGAGQNVALLAGITYGIALLLVSELILPAVQSPMLQIPAIHWAIGHVIYGLVLGYLTGRK